MARLAAFFNVLEEAHREDRRVLRNLQKINRYKSRAIHMDSNTFRRNEISIKCKESQDQLPRVPDEYPNQATGCDSDDAQSLNPPETQATASSRPRRSPRIKRLETQRQEERERLIKIEEKRVEAELTNAAGWDKLCHSIDNLSNAIIASGDKIAQAI